MLQAIRSSRLAPALSRWARCASSASVSGSCSTSVSSAALVGASPSVPAFALPAFALSASPVARAAGVVDGSIRSPSTPSPMGWIWEREAPEAWTPPCGEGEVPAGEVPAPAAPLECNKRTYQPSVLIRKRRHGFLGRIATKNGRKLIQRRRTKGRWKITA